MTSRAAIIGAGLAGLTAANVLADRGIETTVFERSTRPGGRAATTEHGLYRFNQGPHALYLGGHAARVLDGLGITVTGHAPVIDGGLALYRDRLEALPRDARTLLSTRLLGAGAKLTVGRFLARLPSMEGSDLAGTTVDEWVSSTTGDAAAADLLLALIRLSTYANAPGQMSAGAALTQLALASDRGVRYLDGGWSQLVDALRDRAEARAVVIRHETIDRAEALLDDVDVVVVAAGPPSITAALLGTAAHRREPAQERLRPLGHGALGHSPSGRGGLESAAGPRAEAAVLELGVAAVPDTRFILGIDQPLYASVHSPPADLAPPGHSVVCLARYLAPGEDHDAGEVRNELAALAGRMGVTGGQIVTSRYLHRLTVTGGIPLATRGGLAGRPPIDVSGDPRLLIAGDWVGTSGLLADAALASGEAAGRAAADQVTRTAATRAAADGARR